MGGWVHALTQPGFHHRSGAKRVSSVARRITSACYREWWVGETIKTREVRSAKRWVYGRKSATCHLPSLAQRHGSLYLDRFSLGRDLHLMDICRMIVVDDELSEFSGDGEWGRMRDSGGSMPRDGPSAGFSALRTYLVRRTMRALRRRVVMCLKTSLTRRIPPRPLSQPSATPRLSP